MQQSNEIIDSCQNMQQSNKIIDFSQKQTKILDNKKTKSNLKTQLKIIQKILTAWTWPSKNKFTQVILYEISKFVFINPAIFRNLVFKHRSSTNLEIVEKKSYIVINTDVQSQIFFKNQHMTSKKSTQQKLRFPQAQLQYNCFHQQDQENDKIRSGEYTIQLRIIKNWECQNIKYETTPMKEIIAKSRHLMEFFKNIQIDHPQVTTQVQENVWKNNDNETDKQGKLYTLVCQNYDYIFYKISQIQQNEKHKKLDYSISRNYVEMMNKNMVVLSIQRNNANPVSLKSEGRYLYFQNAVKLPLVSRRFYRMYSKMKAYKVQNTYQKLIPHLCLNGRHWQIRSSKANSLQLFQQCKKIDRNQGIIIDRHLNCYRYDDYQLTQV